MVCKQLANGMKKIILIQLISSIQFILFFLIDTDAEAADAAAFDVCNLSNEFR